MKRLSLLTGLAVVVACQDTPTEPVTPPTAMAPPVEAIDCSLQNNNTVKKLTDCVTLEGVQAHLAALQAIADANGGSRVSGTPGYDASVDYVAGVLEEAGYDVTLHPVEYSAFIRVGPSTLAQVAPFPVSYVEGVDFRIFTQSDPGDVTAPVSAVDLQLGLGNASTSGCEPADFAGFPPGHIALMQRGTCTFQLKAENAAAAGATGAIIFNQGNEPGRFGLIGGQVGDAYAGGIPVTEATYPLGEEWASTPGLVMRLHANVFRGDVTAHSVLAETRDGADDNVVMAGAGLDSAEGTPGINDNGSGVAALLEVARQMALVKPRNKVRFAFWAARQAGLIGSDEYVFGLPDEERAAIALYLNFDMIGSPNFAYFVYDGDGSEFGLAGPAGSGAIESFFEGFYEDRGLPYEETTIAFRSDYAAFFDVGIPFGGLFTGAEGVKTPEQAALFGGVAGEQFDPCWGLACDTYDNVNQGALDVNADAVAASVLQYAMSTEAVNGRRGKGNFGAPGGPPAGAGPFRTSAPVR